MLDWSLRSADVPYDNLNELSIDFGMGGLIERSTIIEAVAPNVVAIDLSNQVSGSTARIGVLATKGIDPSQVSIGYRVLDKGTVTSRMTVAGEVLDWVEEEEREVGSTEIAVLPASIANCYARYEGVTYHSGFIVDPSLAQNPRRAAYERFDPELTALAEALATNDRKRARDVEPAVAGLLWMLGFNTCHLGGTKVLQDGPDILGATPAGHVVVVECTIGTLKAESKMPIRCHAVDTRLLRETLERVSEWAEAAERSRVAHGGAPYVAPTTGLAGFNARDRASVIAGDIAASH